MACRLEVVCETRFGDTLVITGADPTLGSWNLSRAVALRTDPEVYPTWSASISTPPPGTEFKFAVIRPGRGVRWEPIACNRRWPAEFLGEGSLLVSAKFGVGDLSISNPGATVVAACAHQDEPEVSQICKQTKTTMVCGCWQNLTDKTRLQQAVQDWEDQVRGAAVGLAREEARAVRIICIEGGSFSSVQKAKQNDVLTAICRELGDLYFPVSFVWMTLNTFKGEFRGCRGGFSLNFSSLMSTSRRKQVHPEAADEAAGGGDDCFTWKDDECTGEDTDSPKIARRPSATPAELQLLADEFYGPGSDEAALIAKEFGAEGPLMLPLPLKEEGCEYFDLSPSPREEASSEEENCVADFTAYTGYNQKTRGASRRLCSSQKRSRKGAKIPPEASPDFTPPGCVSKRSRSTSPRGRRLSRDNIRINRCGPDSPFEATSTDTSEIEPPAIGA
mmetsp:Transcript_104831/g.306165  ORF Transcript_104831/g.306165 Transcript_104831/m.306165 type:complete len:447 (-) Transcript_104831:105-1445(-)